VARELTVRRHTTPTAAQLLLTVYLHTLPTVGTTERSFRVTSRRRDLTLCTEDISTQTIAQTIASPLETIDGLQFAFSTTYTSITITLLLLENPTGVASVSTRALHFWWEKRAHLVDTHTLHPDLSRARNRSVEKAFTATAHGRYVADPLNVNRNGRLETEYALGIHQDFLSGLQVL
jgi:hypothetical protein